MSERELNRVEVLAQVDDGRLPEIADRLGRAPSAIYRELKRNFFDDKELLELNGYHAVD